MHAAAKLLNFWISNQQLSFKYIVNWTIILKLFSKVSLVQMTLFQEISKQEGGGGGTLPTFKFTFTYKYRIRMPRILKNIYTQSCWYSLETSRWVLLDEYPYARVSMMFSGFLHHFVLGKSAISSIRVNCYANFANTKWCKNLKNDWNTGIWVLIWEYSVRAIQWIPTWQGVVSFQKY